ncbi:MAG: LysR family transcriptional regulator [Hyphomonadaceae bacterium]|nr:LysR family transcriptional regulator [Hyphomonadaceae bacterium]
MEWDDLRYVLAVARAGSALRAARDLGVNQTTVIRRLDALEEKLGVPLFDRQRSGNTLTAAGRTVAEAAERMEQEARGLESALAAQQRSLSGLVRLTTSEVLATRFIAPCLRDFRREHPNVSVELLVSDERLDIARGDADVALRGGSRPEGAGVVGRRLQDIYWTVYCSRSYAAERGVPAGREEITGHDIVGLDGRMAQLPASLWLAGAAQGAPIRYRSNSMSNLVTTLKSGLGLGALPTVIGDVEPELQRCFEPPKELVSELWLIVREEIKAHPHVRAFADFLACYIRETLVEQPAG